MENAHNYFCTLLKSLTVIFDCRETEVYSIFDEKFANSKYNATNISKLIKWFLINLYDMWTAESLVQGFSEPTFV